MREIEIRVLGRIRLVRRVGKEIHEDAAGIVDEVAETLGDEDAVDVAGRGMFKLVEIVIGEWIFEGNLDGSGRLIFVVRNIDGHGEYGFTPWRLFRVGAAGKDGEGTVELLGEHDASELVRVGHGAERKLLVGTLAKRVREAVRVSAKEDQLSGTAVAKFAEPFGKGVRIESLSRGVKKNDGGGAVCVQFLNRGVGVAYLSDLDGAGAADTLGVVVEDGAHLGAARFAEHEEAKFHFKPYFLRFSRSVLRLIPSASAERLIW
jgi:hypothetical protein